MLGVGILARRVHILKRQRRVVELHQVKARPTHQHVGIVRPVRARPVLNRHRSPLDDVVQIGATGLHAGAVQGWKQRQGLVVIVGTGRGVQLVLQYPQLLAGDEKGVVARRHVVESVRNDVLIRGAARRPQP